MAKTEITKQIESVVFKKYFLDYSMRCAFEVPFEGGRVDFVAVDRNNKFIFVEIKRLLFPSSFQRKVNIFLQCLLIFCFCNSKSGDQRKRGQNGKSGISRIS